MLTVDSVVSSTTRSFHTRFTSSHNKPPVIKTGRINESTIPYSGLTNLTECCAPHTAACPNWSALLSDLPISKRYSIRPKSFSPGVEQDSHSKLPAPCRTSTKNRLPKLDNDVPLDVSNSHVERPHPQLNVNYPIRTTKIDAERVRAVARCPRVRWPQGQGSVTASKTY